MAGKDDFFDRARGNLIAALGEFQNGKMNCDGVSCQECYFFSCCNPAGEQCEIVGMELKLCGLLKAMDKPSPSRA